MSPLEKQCFDAEFCVVCNEPVEGRRHIALGLFVVQNEGGEALWFEPEEEPQKLKTYRDVMFLRTVHIECVSAYFDAVSVEAHLRAARGECEEEEE